MGFGFKDRPEVVVTKDLVIRTLLMEGLEVILKDNKTYGDFVAAGEIFEKNACRVSKAGSLEQEKVFLWDALGCYVHARRSIRLNSNNLDYVKTTALIGNVMEKLQVIGVSEILVSKEKFEGHALVYAALLRS